MCEVDVINQTLMGLSRRSFNRRIDSLSSPVKKEKMALSRLNGQLDKCYDLLYEAYPTVTEADYEKIRPYLQILLTTISELIETYSVSPLSLSLADGVERLRRNYSALYEINSDIQNFRIKIHKNPRFHAAMAQLKEQSN